MNATKPSINEVLKERILVLDGAMVTMMQKYNLKEKDFRGERFRNHSCALKGKNDILALTRPDVIAAIRESYCEARQTLLKPIHSEERV